MQNNKPIIGITMGDPSSIGPEITVKTLNHKKVHEICYPVIVGDAKVIEKAVSDLKLNKKVKRIKDINEAEYFFDTINVFDLDLVDVDKLKIGQVSKESGEAAFQSVKKVIELALNKDVDATVTGPLHKESINLAGHKFSGHTEIYAHYTNTKKYAMLLVEEDLRVIHVSTHVSLRQACDAVKKDRIIEVTELINDACKQFGIESPRIAVAALNPHAGDGGLFGDEEIKEIIPAIKELKKKGINAEGPYPADTLFAIAKGGTFDGCVAMYHDQGHIPFKLVGFNWDKETNKMKSVRGVNITLGLPIIRTSVDHGTAFEIAGKGIASEDAMVLAIEYAVQMVNNKYSNK
ncbi:4-hydroxythreonine-4-phosphate dehydrogenase [hydrocarbon metagenome]|uniref:4-hydroxythreonine-4-phosphate dehydrogenase n=1 Tax=hydrocarbon metagenome TaxID=938273 RepID=A0A0W8FW49_9ZZZZ